MNDYSNRVNIKPTFKYYGLKNGENVSVFPPDRFGIEFLAPYVMGRNEKGWFLISRNMTNRISCDLFDSFVKEGHWVEMKELPASILPVNQNAHSSVSNH